MGNIPYAILLKRWGRELNTGLFDVSDHPRLTERGVKFFQRKVESFEEVSFRAGMGLMWEREEGSLLFPVAWLGAPFSAFQGPFEAHLSLQAFCQSQKDSGIPP